MSQWNLSVRLSGQGSGLARTLRDTAADAQNASDEVNALRRNLTLLRAEASNNISIRLELDAEDLRRDVRAALTTAGHGDALSVDLRLANAMDFRRDVQNAIRWAAWGHRIEVPLVLRDPNSLRNQVSDAVRRAQRNQTIRIRVTADTSDLRTVTRGLNNNRGGGMAGSNKTDFGLKGLLTFLPAAIPLTAGLSATLAPLAAQFTAAGIAGAAFGIAVAGQIGPLSDFADAEQKYQDAIRQHGAASKEAAQAQLAMQQQLASMPAATQKAAIAVSTLKSDFSAWSDDMARFTMEPVTKGITVLDQLIPRLTPEVKSASTQLDRLVSVAGGAIQTPGFDALSDKIASFTDGKLEHLTDEVIHLMRVLSEGGADHGAIGAFVEFAQANGPAARDAIKALGQAVIVLVQGAAQAGPSMLTLVTAAARLVAAMPPQLVGIILHVAAALKLLQLSGAGMAALAGGLTRVRTQILALGTASAAAGGGLAGLRAAFLALGTAAKAGIVIAGIAALAYGVSKLSDIGKDAKESVDDLARSIETGLTKGHIDSSAIDDLRKAQKGLLKETDDTASGWDKFVHGFKTGGSAWSDTASSSQAVTNNMRDLGNAINEITKTKGLETARQAMAMLEAQGIHIPTKYLKDYNNALADSALEAELTARSMGIFGDAAADTQAKLNAQKQAADGLRQSILALNEANRSAYDAQIGFESSLDDLTEAFKKNGATLDLNTRAGQANGQAMSDAAKANDEMIASGIAAGDSLASMQQKSDQLRTTMVRLATEAFGGNKKKAQEYVNTLLGTPDQIKTMVKLERQDAVRGLGEVRAAIEKTPNAHKITVSTLNAAAIAALEAVGLKTRQLPDGRTEVFTANGGALGGISAVMAALNALNGKTATTYIKTVRVGGSYGNKQVPLSADGGLMRRAAGGTTNPVQHFDQGGFIRGPGGPRSDDILATFASGAKSWVSNTEYVIQAAAVRKYGVRTMDALNQGQLVLPRLASGGPTGLPHLAGGGAANFTYSPSGGMKSTLDVMSAYSNAHQPISRDDYNKKLRARANAVDALRAAEARLNQVRKGRHTNAQLVAAENAVAKARRSLATATDAAASAEARYKKKFSLSDWGKTLGSAVKANASYESNLNKIATRGAGGDVIEQLRDMGAEGASVVSALAKASKKQFNDIITNLRKLGPLAKATLADYTKQLTDSTKSDTTFQDNLSKLASMGYGDLAMQLAAQGDDAAKKLAADAVKNKTSAKKANDAAKKAKTTLSDDERTDLVQIIAAITSSKTGIHDVAAKTSLGEDEIITVATKAKSQISKSLGSRATKFLADLGRANQHLSYADGGIRAGMYATSGGIVRFAEPETHGEAYLPLSPSKRRTALPVLADVAHRFGLGLTDVAASRAVVVIREGGDTHVNVTAVRTGATASDIGAQVGRSVRRARRGGVAARAA
ncbi:hypothetical protein [Streptomyces sp. NPDC048521]|uniref:hypothetical protein n=1 Tax=Streptomyces sp. NPDC048521 TaxID=3365566 RepID=UPI0037236A9D